MPAPRALSLQIPRYSCSLSPRLFPPLAHMHMLMRMDMDMMLTVAFTTGHS